jgi:DNA processing protein
LGGAEAAIAALPALSRRGGGHTIRLCSEAEAEAEIALGHRVGATLVGIGEPGYPHALAEIECLSLKGDASPLARRPIASDKA